MWLRVASFEGGDFELLRQRQQATKAREALLAKLTTIEQAGGQTLERDPGDPRLSDAAVALLLETVKLTQPDPQRARAA